MGPKDRLGSNPRIRYRGERWPSRNPSDSAQAEAGAVEAAQTGCVVMLDLDAYETGLCLRVRKRRMGRTPGLRRAIR